MSEPEDFAGHGEEIAVVGMTGRFPGAAGVDELWENLRDGVESISFFGDGELLAAGVPPSLLAHPRYVRARGVLAGADLFDAAFFGLSPREAAITDPQQRVFLECAWEALEDAGVDPETYPGRIGVYAGSIVSTYLLHNLYAQVAAGDDASWQVMLANDKDALATRVSYKLDLRGPSVAVQTACSTSLVAVHLARQSLLDYECDVALAGGVAIRSPQSVGYLYQEAGIHSPDGHCRAFDAGARGTVFGGGAGIVVLKRLADAVADGDTVRAVLKGSAINNDGGDKVGFTAPGVEGQARVVAQALELAGVDPATVQYVEAHGTATPLGDPIEIAALTRAFRARGAHGARGGTSVCAVGSIKTNVGHLDAAAGVAGLIKTVLALEHREIPPSLHFAIPNPQIDFAGSPFYVNDRLRPWERGSTPRRAGVSSFGIGGTNAHVVVEEAPELEPDSIPAPRACQLLVLSAKTESALASAAARLAAHLRRRPEQALADVAHTLQVGRRALPWRRTVVCAGRDEAVAGLEAGGGEPAVRRMEGTPAVVFLFPGQGSQRPGMGRGLYRAEPVFRREVDRCAEILRPHLGDDLRELLGLRVEDGPADLPDPLRLDRLDQTAVTQPALFVIEAALARLWMSWGVRPQAMLGHSVGEYVAAHLAGVLSLEDALALVAARGRLVAELPGGAMLAVPLAEAELAGRLGPELSLAAVNGPAQCVVSGPEGAVEALRAELLARGIEGRRLPTSHAFHSRQLDPLLERFARRVGEAALQPPAIPYLSNVTGRWVTPEEATDPGYWALHLRRTVRFADGLDALLAEPDRVLLEVGPGQALTRLARRQCDLRGERGRLAVASLRADSPQVSENPSGEVSGEPPSETSEPAALLAALGRLWQEGTPVDWAGFHAGERRRRVPLPTYPFERRRHWIEPAPAAARAEGALRPAGEDPASWFFLPSWRRALAPAPAAPEERDDGAGWLVIGDGCGLGPVLAARLAGEGAAVVRVDDAECGAGPLDHAALLARLRGEGRPPRFVLHLRSLTAGPAPGFAAAQERGFADLCALTRALAGAGLGDGATVAAVSNGVQRVTGTEELCPAKATLLGWLRSAPRDVVGSLGPRRLSLDVALPAPGARQTLLTERLADRILAEIRSSAPAPSVAYRGDDRWVPALEPAPLPAPARPAAWLRPGGRYLVLGGPGSDLDASGDLARALGARLAAEAPVRLAFLAPPGQAERGAAARLRALAGRGTEVLVEEAAPADPRSLRAALARIEETWGPLHGVFHLPGQGGPAEWMASARALDAVLGDERPLDFLVLVSWLEPPPAVRDDPQAWAACAFLDALAEERAARGAAPTVAVAWGADSGSGFDRPETFAALDRILAHGVPPRIVVALPPPAAAERAALLEGAAGGAADDLPDDPIARRIAAIWRQALGLERIGARDRFFDVGGDSLIAVQVMTRLRDAFPVNLPVQLLFERPTVPALRDAVEEALTARLEELSEDEAERLAASVFAASPGA